MRNANETHAPGELEQLCASVRAFVIDGAYDSCMEPICRAMAHYPDAPQPHNLLGIVLEKTGDHAGAMKHFRAAWALDPTYRPANHNMHIYATFYSDGKCAFDESDVPPPPESTIEIVCDERGIGRIERKWKFEYDRHGVGRAVRS
ncbi:MAG: hypothetical protein Q4A66_07020 [Eubacteriales bacterium]|nr:hypothetical protein [Eubacteriales bacterium]